MQDQLLKIKKEAENELKELDESLAKLTERKSSLLSFLTELMKRWPSNGTLEVRPKDGRQVVWPQIKKVFREVVHPLTVRELLVRINYPKPYTTFSAYISNQLTDERPKLKRYVVEGAPIQVKNWIGLAEWFDGNVPLPQYLSSIKKAVRAFELKKAAGAALELEYGESSK